MPHSALLGDSIFDNCAHYDSIPDLEPRAHAALSMFNEVILRGALSARVNIIDLRLVCSERSDYSELSRIGGDKIAAVLRNLLLGGSDPATSSNSLYDHYLNSSKMIQPRSSGIRTLHFYGSTDCSCLQHISRKHFIMDSRTLTTIADR
jgi:hypothetical protein